MAFPREATRRPFFPHGRAAIFNNSLDLRISLALDASEGLSMGGTT
jgi:hypothetical protein